MAAAMTIRHLAILARLLQWVGRGRMGDHTISPLDQTYLFLLITRLSGSTNLVATIEEKAGKGEILVIVILAISAIPLESVRLARSMMVEVDATLDTRALRTNEPTETEMASDDQMTTIEKVNRPVDLEGLIKIGRAEPPKMVARLIAMKRALPHRQHRKMHQRIRPNP